MPGPLTGGVFAAQGANTDITSITGSAASLSVSGQTGLLTVTGLTSTSRAKTVRDAADTILELGGSYTPTGVYNFTNASGQAITLAPAANTAATGWLLTDATAATSGNQQYSPAVRWTGQGWKTTATAASQAVDFRAYVVPVQGTANPKANWTLESSINGGAFSFPLIVNSDGYITVTPNTGTNPNQNGEWWIKQAASSTGFGTVSGELGSTAITFWSNNVEVAAFNIPGAAGTPSGTPTNTTAFPMYWDSTNLKLYIYTGGAWKSSAAFT